MGFLRRLLRPRRHPRYYAKKGTFVVITPYTTGEKKERKIQILDVSEGGCAFIYSGTREELVESGLLSLIADDTSYLESVDFATVSDDPVSGTQDSSANLRRRGIEFKWLGVFDRERVKEFIEQSSIGRAS
ncbi:MAG: hypothetical protein FJ139_10800 [Deltaproteobacteria bacterium]|nr:hypothetical protein [Deltaproteobacteria bacterium]